MTQQPHVELPGDRTRILISVLIILGTALFSAYYYQDLPDKIPMHFGKNGRPDGWGPKGVAIGVMIGVQLFVAGLMAFSYWGVRHPDKMGINKKYMSTDPEVLKMVMPTALILLDGILYGLLLLFADANYESVMVALGQQGGLSWRFFVLLVFVLGWSLIWSVVLVVKVQRAKKHLARKDST